jgi:DNA gyrase subunit A
MNIIKDELREIKEKYNDERRTKIEFAASDFKIEDTIPDEEVVVTISHLGYIKRTPLSEYKVQGRGGRGSRASTVRNEDFLEYLFIATNHNYLLFFTEQGKCFWLRVYEIPEGSRTSKGRAIQNLLNIAPDDKIKAFINTKDLKDEEYINSHYILMVTAKGIIKKTSLEEYSRPRQNGINAITIREDDMLYQARMTDGKSEVIIALKSGRAIRFNESTVRPMGRNASGVRGISLAGKDDAVIGMISMDSLDYDVLVVSENGYGKRSKLDDYRITNRGGKGVKTLNITPKTGDLISIKNVTDKDDLMIINKSGLTIRLAVSQLRVMGRATQGVRLINLRDEDAIAAVAKVEVEDDEETQDGLLENENGDVNNENEINETPDNETEEDNNDSEITNS